MSRCFASGSRGSPRASYLALLSPLLLPSINCPVTELLPKALSLWLGPEMPGDLYNPRQMSTSRELLVWQPV